MSRPSILYFLLAFSLFSCSDLGVGPDPDTRFYWVNGEKVYLEIDRKTVIAIYKSDSATTPLRMEKLRFSRPNYATPLRTLVLERGFDPDRFEWLSFSCRSIGGYEQIPLNEIVFALQPGYTTAVIDSLVDGEAVLHKVGLYSQVYKLTRQEGDVFALADRIYRSGYVRYAEPNFISRTGPAGE